MRRECCKISESNKFQAFKMPRIDRSVAKFNAIFKLPNLKTIAIHLQHRDSKTQRSCTHQIRLRIISMYPRNKSAVCTKNASPRRIHREFSANSQTIRIRLFPCISRSSTECVSRFLYFIHCCVLVLSSFTVR